MSGTEQDGIELDINQMSDNGHFEISDPKEFIAEKMFLCLESYIDVHYDIQFIRELLDTDGKHRLLLNDDDYDNLIDCVVLSIDNINRSYYYDLSGEFRARQIFKVSELEDDDVAYLVSEHIINPYPGCDLIERCYRKYFDDESAAQRYCSNRMKNYFTAQGLSSSGYRVSVVSKKAMSDSHWYNANIMAAENIKSYSLDAESYRYIADIDDVNSAILANAYDDLSVEDQAQVNYNIYKLMRDFIDIEACMQLDDDVDRADPAAMEEIADIAILLAFVDAPDEQTFHKLHEILGPHDYRVGSLTDSIYNSHPDSGYIILTKDGELAWYQDCYAINSWDGAKGNPYFGKFQLNENDTLLCLREYHPELIVDRPPSEREIAKYDKMYKDELLHIRGKHSEMQFGNDGEREIVIGDWYPQGLTNNKCYAETVFGHLYGSHEFSAAECKTLLSGEELTIEHFVSKSGIETTVRGKLKDVSGPFDDGPRIEFVRTDQGSSKRLQLNSEFGINEPGLPRDDE
jgi:hypothetical protein